jgi:hypothetical protein
MWGVSWELNPARVKASGRGAKCYPRRVYPVQILKIFAKYIKNDRNPIQWTSGITRLPPPNQPGFESALYQSTIYSEAFFIFLQCRKDFHFFSYACFLLVKNARKISYNRNPVKGV